MAVGSAKLAAEIKSTRDQLEQLESIVGGDGAPGLPEGWVELKLERISKIISGNAFKSKDFVTEGSPVVKISNVQAGYYIEKNQEFLPPSALQENEGFSVNPLDILIALTRPITNDRLKICRYPKNGDVALLNQRVAKIDINKGCSSQYFNHLFQSKLFKDQVESNLTETLQPNLSPKTLALLETPLPPLAEQTVIAQTLDTLLAQVDNIKTRLDAIPKILKTFRKSVLAAAVSGKLTEEWRGDNEKTDNFDYKKACKSEREELLDKKTKKLVGIEDFPEIEIPKTWVWQSLDESSLRITDGTHFSPKSTSSGDFMYITSKNVRAGYIDLTKISYVDEITHRGIYKRCDVKKGDVLYVKDGANTGLACVNTIEEEISLLSSVGVFKVCSFVNPKYLEHYLNSPMGRKLMLGMMGGTAIPRLTLTKLAKAPFSLPPIKEQTQIVRRVEELFAFADQIEKQVKNAQARVNNLTQSILAKAFRGELTAQWRADNPDLISGENSAAALLAKIQAEREALKPKKKTAQKTKAKKEAAN